MSISKKLFFGFFIVIFISIIVGIISIAGMQRLQNAGDAMYKKQIHSLEYIGRAATKFREIRRMFNQVVTNSWYDDKKGALDAKEKHELYIHEFLDLLRESYEAATTSETDEFTKFYIRVLELFNNETIPLFDDAINACIYDIPDHYNKHYIRIKMASINKITNEIEELLLGIMDLNSALAKQNSIDNTAKTQFTIILLAVLLVFTVIIAAVVAFFITRSIAVPINESAGVLGEIANGNFMARVNGRYKGELALIKDSVNNTAEKLELYLENKIDAERASHESDIARERADAIRETVMSSIRYASKIQKNLLPPDSTMKNAFMDYSVIWKPRDIVGGDIYWMKSFDKGTLLCVCDCTGHGTPGALLTMLVTSALEAVVTPENCEDTAEVIWQLEQRLVTIFNLKFDEGEQSDLDIKDGCDLAVLFASNDKSVTLSSGNMNVFVCNKQEARRIKGQKIYIGEGNIESKESIKVTHIPADTDNVFYIASDGLFEQPGGEYSGPFGYARFMKLIKEFHGEKQSVISNRIWDAYEEYRGEEPQIDDFELITFKVG